MGISSLGYYFNIFFSWKIFPNSKTAYNESQLRLYDRRGHKTSDHAEERDPSRELSVSINYGCKTAVDKEPLI